MGATVRHINSGKGTVTILNPDLDKKDVSDRGVVLDLRLRLLDGSQINVEMQMGPRPGMRQRALYHWARMYSSQLLTDQLELHLVQLRQLAALGSQEAEQEGALVGWGRFLMARDEQEREALAMTDPNLAKAKEVLDEAHTRFGEVPSEVALRVETATSEQLTRWGDRLMTVDSLEAWCAAMEDGE